MDHLLAFDGAGDDVQILAFELDGDRWRLIRDDPAPERFQLPPIPESAQLHRWKETHWVQTVEGWLATYSEGEFVLTQEQQALMKASYERMIAEGKLTVWSTADRP